MNNHLDWDLISHSYISFRYFACLFRVKRAHKNVIIHVLLHIFEPFEDAVAELAFLEGESDLQMKQRQMSYMFITRFLPFMLERKDRTSMMNGFEVRVPFCDYRLVEYLWNVPFEMKSIDNIEKGILRRAFENVLPEDVRYRKKCISKH